MSAATLPLTVAWFENRGVKGEGAYGDPEVLPWSEFVSIVTAWRREGDKDGSSFVPARFKLEPDGRHVRRVGRNVVTRSMVVLDLERHKTTGEIPPSLDEAMSRAQALGWAAVGYTSHNHGPDNIRYRLALPLSQEIDPQLPAVEVIADALCLGGVLDTSKVAPASLFYMPSAPYDALDHHQAVAVWGEAVSADWMAQHAGALLAARQAEADRIATEAQAEAAARREAKLAAGFDPDDSVIERIRAHLDLAAVLTSHGYDRAGARWRHPNSQSGGYGANIKILGGVERVFSHNGTDPLHGSNLPDWCGVTALDGFDVVAILEFHGNRKRAIADLTQRFGLTKKAEKKTIAGLLFRLIRRHAPQQEIEAIAFAEGARQGLSRADIISVAVWVAEQATRRAA